MDVLIKFWSEKTDVLSLKTKVFLKLKRSFLNKMFIYRCAKHAHFRNIQIYGNYHVLIDSKYLQKIWFDSNFNWIFDFVHGPHCLTVNVKYTCHKYKIKLFSSPKQILSVWVLHIIDWLES